MTKFPDGTRAVFDEAHIRAMYPIHDDEEPQKERAPAPPPEPTWIIKLRASNVALLAAAKEALRLLGTNDVIEAAIQQAEELP